VNSGKAQANAAPLGRLGPKGLVSRSLQRNLNIETWRAHHSTALFWLPARSLLTVPDAHEHPPACLFGRHALAVAPIG
jgi:hypothetical protein